VLSTAWSQEQLKQRLVKLNPRFYLVDARNPMATYRVLWYRVSEARPLSSLANSSFYSTFSYSSHSGVRIKVDILLPGAMNIPLFPAEKITWDAGLPSAPFILVLLLKLQAWFQHRHSTESRFRVKQFTDHSDLQALLAIARSKGVRVLPQAPSEAYLSQDFLMNSVARVADHIKMYPYCKDDWARLGFDVPNTTAGASAGSSSGTASKMSSSTPTRPTFGRRRRPPRPATATTVRLPREDRKEFSICDLRIEDLRIAEIVRRGMPG